MADPIGFPQVNSTYVGEGEVVPLPTFRGTFDNDVPVLISCWQLTLRERHQINQTGIVWHYTLGHVTPPISIGGANPWYGISQGSETGEDDGERVPETVQQAHDGPTGVGQPDTVNAEPRQDALGSP